MEDAITNSYVFREVVVDRKMVLLYIRGSIVEVRGQAADEHERSLIVDVIAGVVAPLAVQNRLFVDSEHRRSTDRWVEARVRAGLQTVGGHDAAGVAVAVAGDQVVLSGTARSEGQRTLTHRLTQAMSGPRTVRNDLQLAPESPLRQVRIDDVSVVAMARQVLSMHQTGAAVVLSCREGRLLVDGTVVEESDRARLIDLLGSVRGVVGVVDRLRVAPQAAAR